MSASDVSTGAHTCASWQGTVAELAATVACEPSMDPPRALLASTLCAVRIPLREVPTSWPRFHTLIPTIASAAHPLSTSVPIRAIGRDWPGRSVPAIGVRL